MAETELSTAEAELYDRQIRLWGFESQQKLRNANVLLIGARGLGSEIAKNILLSGINSLTILDDGTVTEEELIKNFLLNPDSLGKKIAEAILIKAQALNPLVKITADTQSLSEKSEKYFSEFTIIVATGLTTKQLLHVNSICRASNVQFICGDVFGLFGFTLADFQEHEYYVDQVHYPNKRTHEGKPTTSEVTTFKKHGKMNYPPIDQVLSVSEKKTLKSPKERKRNRRNELYYFVKLLLEFRDKIGRNPSYNNKNEDLKTLMEIRREILERFQIDEDKIKEDMLNLVFGEIAPICAIVGGVIAQEVIKAVSHKEVPIYNMFLLNPFNYKGTEAIFGV